MISEWFLFALAAFFVCVGVMLNNTLIFIGTAVAFLLLAIQLTYPANHLLFDLYIVCSIGFFLAPIIALVNNRR